jgi:hypothetical protein
VAGPAVMLIPQPNSQRRDPPLFPARSPRGAAAADLRRTFAEISRHARDRSSVDAKKPRICGRVQLSHRARKPHYVSSATGLASGALQQPHHLPDDVDSRLGGLRLRAATIPRNKWLSVGVAIGGCHAHHCLIVRHSCATSRCPDGLCWGLLGDKTDGQSITRDGDLGVFLP